MQVLDRTPLLDCTNPASYDTANTQLPAANELGLKDTVVSPPCTVTRVAAVFDLPGHYVFHCHMLSHEDNDAMRPFHVA